MTKKRLTTFTFLLFFIASYAQIGDNDLRDYFNSIVFLRDSITRVEKINNKQFELHLKDPKTGITFPLKYQISGSGFLVNKGLDDYLVTAQHVATKLTEETSLIFRNKSGSRKEIKIKDIKSDNAEWKFHPKADIAVLNINLFDKDSTFINNLEIGDLDYWDISRLQIAPDRFEELIVVGFPLGLGVSPQTISPITKKVKASSDLIVINRFDNGKPSFFYLLDDPSVSGFSGGPVIKINEPLFSKDKKSYLKGSMKILGLVHGTINDPVDKAGRFAAIVPSFQIKEAIDLASSFSGNYSFKYPDGTLWSERNYKNGVPWTVFSNYKPNGQSQEKGTLKNGTGTLYIYYEKGKLYLVETYKNGERISSSPVMTDKELREFGGFKPVNEN